MRPTDLAPQLNHQLEEAKDQAAHIDVTPLLRQAHEAASIVRSTAGRAGEPVQIRVVRTNNGVRVTVLGPRAGKYRALMERELEQRTNSAAYEIREQFRSRK